MSFRSRQPGRIKPWLLAVAFAAIIAIAAAPFAWNAFLTDSHSIVIDAPVQSVWEYIGDSGNAAEWSVFFERIKPLPGVKDGKTGALRRCFRASDDPGAIWWDEITLETRTMEYRRILAFNAHNFADPKMNHGEYYVFQHFEELHPGRTKLTFGHKQLKPTGIRDRLGFLGAAREGSRIIRENLENIKEAIESRHQGRPYQRPHPYIEPGTHMFEIPTGHG